ncbi:MAG: hypothetical protein PHW60_08550 [Kiritimatiellae bacterium]|nr:hypothetical protein [Kiritimatiellia bacterium]
MAKSKLLEQRFGPAAHGVRWAAGRVPGMVQDAGNFTLGKRRLIFRTPDKPAGDAFAVAWTEQNVTIDAATATGTIGALLELARRTAAGKFEDFACTLKFKSRNYKHEVNLRVGAAPPNAPPWLGGYTDRLMEAFFQELAARHFNGFVVYCGYHPFEFFLDYAGFAHATHIPAAERKLTRAALRRLFGWAQKYGLRTFLHHYATHFTQALADHLKLGISARGSLLANFEHPVVEEYNRYIYRRTREVLPELDGYYINFESSGNAVPYMQKTLVRVANALAKKPVLFFRLWGVSDVAGMTQLLRSYRGPKALVHKSHDTSDFYFYPVADARVAVWKKAMPEVEFTFSLGPCHNCAANITQKLWTDPAYIQALLASIEARGADSISCQSSHELLLDALPGKTIFRKWLQSHARMNRGHVEAVVDYVRGEAPAPQAWAQRYAAWFGTTPAAGRAIRDAIFKSSQIVLLGYQQFCYGSAAEGGFHPGRFSHYQEPFFYYPMSFMNRFGAIRPNVRWRTWVVRDKVTKVVPDDTQAPIDSVNPAIKRKAARGPRYMIRQLQTYIAASQAAVKRLRQLVGPGADKALIGAVAQNCRRGERIWREIAVARELGACYFAGSKAAFRRHLANARSILLDAINVLGPHLHATDDFCMPNFHARWQPQKDADAITAILAASKADYPAAALTAYLGSHERYNEIRRMSRPYVSVRGPIMARNLKLLKASLAAAEQALAKLANSAKLAVYYDNVRAWRNYVRAEIDGATPPAMQCFADDAVGRDSGFRAMVHDQHYRWGESSLEDFASFFRRVNFDRDVHTQLRITHTGAGLKLALREFDINFARRRATWEQKRGTVQQNEFMEIFIDAGNTGERVFDYRIFYEGKGGIRRLFRDRSGTLSEMTTPEPIPGYHAHFEHTDTSWRIDVVIPWSQLGGKPKRHDVWRVNVLSNPAAGINTFGAWCQGYDYRNDTARLGTIIFA